VGLAITTDCASIRNKSLSIWLGSYMQQLIFSFLKVTQNAAIAAAKAAGLGDKKYADKCATEAMRKTFNSIPFKGRVVIGEGERDKAPMLYIGEELGRRSGKGLMEIDIAVDPLENTNATAKALPNAISVMATSEKSGLLGAPDVYMDKLVVGPKIVGKVNITAPVEKNLINIARGLKKKVNELKIVILDRERHHDLISKIRKTGAKVKLIPDGDVLGGLSAIVPGTGIDALMGIGAAPEGVITAAAVYCLGGEMQGRFVTSKEEESGRIIKAQGLDPSRVYKTKDLVSGKQVFFCCTGVTDGDIVKGVKFSEEVVKTQSIILYKDLKENQAFLVNSIQTFKKEKLNISLILS
jgi:fructose-1,6-bisphosphatase II